jgi:lipopolysaccharide transport protein LptA
VVELDGSVQVESAGALINGEHIRSESGIVTITGDEALGRAQMVLVQAGGLGLSGSTDLNETTLIHADRIVMREKAKETEFEFEGRVEIFSGSLTLRAEQLLVYSSPHKKDSDNTEDAEDLPVGEVRELYARGSVYIEDRGMEVQAEEGRFFPMKERAKLSGNPRLSHEGAVVSGARMELSATKARVFAEGDRRVRVLLPELPNLGYDAEGEATVISNEATLVESNRLEMNRSEEGQLYIFEEKVEVTGTNLKAYCERMEVKAVRGSLEASSSEGLMDGTQIETIEAMDGVRIEQEGRVATSDRALIEPLTSRLVLTGDARVDDERGQVRGERLILNQGERRAIVEAGGDGKRARVTLPELPQSRD